jgi:hypothetical protein
MRNLEGDPFDEYHLEREGSGCSGDTSVARVLLAHGAVADVQDKRGQTAADIARGMTCPIWTQSGSESGRPPGPNAIIDLLK